MQFYSITFHTRAQQYRGARADWVNVGSSFRHQAAITSGHKLHLHCCVALMNVQEDGAAMKKIVSSHGLSYRSVGGGSDTSGSTAVE